MAYTRYVQIYSSSTTTRTIATGASELRCWLSGRERGGLCQRAEVVIPAAFPEDFGICRGDLLVVGWNSTAANHWWHGVVHKIERGGPGSTSISIEAYGIEEFLKSIKPRINFGANAANPYVSYDNESITKVSTISTTSIISTLWNDYIKSALPWVTDVKDLDTSDTSTDIEYLEFDGATSLYDIFNSLAERTGMSWGFDPTSNIAAHKFFFKNPSSSIDPEHSRFYHKSKGDCIGLSISSSINQITNEVQITGSPVPHLGKQFSRKLYESTSQSAYGPIALTRRVPGVTRSTDAKKHAAAVLARRYNPSSSIEVECIIDDSMMTNAGPPLLPGQTKIDICNAYGSPYNPSSDQKYTDEIECEFESHTIRLKFKLGEDEPNDQSLIQSTIVNQSASSTPKATYQYTAESGEWTEDTDQRGKTDRVEVVSIPGVLESEPSGDPLTANVRLANDSDGGDDSDSYRELYTGIPVPTGLDSGDWVDIQHWFEDDELQEVTAALPGAGDADAVGLTLGEIQLALANGTLALLNSTKLLDISNYSPTGATDININPATSPYPAARLGHLARVPVADKVALNTGVYALVSADYNTAGIALPGTVADALLFGNVLGITSNGEVALGNPSGGYVLIDVKTTDSGIHTMRLITATDPTFGTVAAPLGAVLRGNS